MWQALTGIVSGVLNIFGTVIGGRTQKTLQRRALRASAFLAMQEYDFKSKLLTQQADIVESQQEFELEKIKLLQQPLTSKANTETSFFEENKLYIILAIALLILLLLRKKKK